MLARLILKLPFSLSLPEGEKFTVYEYEDSGYKARIYPPMRSDITPSGVYPDQFKIDGVPAFHTDALRIDFQKDSFDRQIGSVTQAGFFCDPPEHVVNRAINSFITRLRHVVHAPQVRPLNLRSTSFHLDYLNDDGTELEEKEGFIRGCKPISYSFSWIALTKKIWDDVCNLPLDYEPPPWEGLLLDAKAELPSIGPAIVLAATALEVFISKVLDQLAMIKNAPPELWKWINQRGNRTQEPTFNEQYDFLLKFLTGHSLKEEQRLWESFQNLKDARNSFVHEGVAKIGKTQTVDTETAQKLITSSFEVISKIKEWLPKELHWPEFKYEVEIEGQKKLNIAKSTGR